MPEKFVDEIEVNDFLVALIKIQNALHGGVRRGLLFLPLTVWSHSSGRRRIQTRPKAKSYLVS